MTYNVLIGTLNPGH